MTNTVAGIKQKCRETCPGAGWRMIIAGQPAPEDKFTHSYFLIMKQALL
jgi:hypothetical protein